MPFIPFASAKLARFDLNGDGHPEIFAYANDRDHCGSGGCALRVLTPTATGYHIVLRGTVIVPDIGVAATRTHGWRDIIVSTRYGARAHPMRLRFDGQRYPNNPSVPPATPFRDRISQVLIEHAD